MNTHSRFTAPILAYAFCIAQSANAATADLAVSQLSFSPPAINAGAHPTSVSFQLHNYGSASLTSASVRAELFLFDDQVGLIPMGFVDYPVTVSSGGDTLVLLAASQVPSLTISNKVRGRYGVRIRVSHSPGSPYIDPFTGDNMTSGPDVNVLSPAEITQTSVDKTTVAINQPFKVTVKGRHNWSETYSGGMSMQVRQAFTQNSEVSVTSVVAANANPAKQVWWKGETFASGQVAQYLQVEPSWGSWSSMEEKLMEITLTPKKVGTFDIYAKMYLSSAGQYYLCPGIRESLDHQGEGTVWVATVTVVQLPNLTKLSRAGGPVGMLLVLTGSNFGTSRGSSYVTFNGIQATSYTNWTYTEIRVVVPSGAANGNVIVTTAGGASNPIYFFVDPAPVPQLRNWGVSKSVVNVGEPFEVFADLRNNGGSSDHGGISISFPDLTGTDPVMPPYESALADVSTHANTTFPTVGYFDQGDGLNTGPAAHLLVEGDSTNWVNLESRTLKLRVTPKQAGTLKIRLRGALAVGGPGGWGPPVLRDPAGSGAGLEQDQQGYWAYVTNITVQPTNLLVRTVNLGNAGNFDLYARSPIVPNPLERADAMPIYQSDLVMMDSIFLTPAGSNTPIPRAEALGSGLTDALATFVTLQASFVSFSYRPWITADGAFIYASPEYGWPKLETAFFFGFDRNSRKNIYYKFLLDGTAFKNTPLDQTYITNMAGTAQEPQSVVEQLNASDANELLADIAVLKKAYGIAASAWSGAATIGQFDDPDIRGLLETLPTDVPLGTGSYLKAYRVLSKFKQSHPQEAAALTSFFRWGQFAIYLTDEILDYQSRVSTEMVLRSYLNSSKQAQDCVTAYRHAYDYARANYQPTLDAALGDAISQLETEVTSQLATVDANVGEFLRSGKDPSELAALLLQLNSVSKGRVVSLAGKLVERLVSTINKNAGNAFHEAWKGLPAQTVAAVAAGALESLERVNAKLDFYREHSCLTTIHETIRQYELRSAWYRWFAPQNPILQTDAFVEFRNAQLLDMYFAQRVSARVLDEYVTKGALDWAQMGVSAAVGVIEAPSSGGWSLVSPFVAIEDEILTVLKSNAFSSALHSIEADRENSVTNLIKNFLVTDSSRVLIRSLYQATQASVVAPIEGPPNPTLKILPIPDQTVSVGKTLTNKIQFTGLADNDTAIITFSGLANGSGDTITYTPTAADVGERFIRVVATSSQSGNDQSTNRIQVLGITPPFVTIAPASGQPDPVTNSPVNFTVAFSEPVTGFTKTGVLLEGSASPSEVVVTGSGVIYNVAVSGMATNGSVVVSIVPGAAVDGEGHANEASLGSGVVQYAPQLHSPVMQRPRLAGGVFSVTVGTELGPTYALEYKHSVMETTWSSSQALPGTGGSVTLTDSTATNVARFYRIRVFR